MDEQNKNLLLATALSFLVILVWFILFPPPEPPQDDIALPEETQATTPLGDGVAAAPNTAPGLATPQSTPQDGDVSAVEGARLSIETERLEGSISLTGGRLDELRLKDYRVTADPGAPTVQILAPVGSNDPYYALYGWAPGTGLSLDTVPGANTPWQVVEGDTLTTTDTVVLEWQSPAGLVFSREISVDADFMFTVTQSVENRSDATVSAAPYGIIARHGEPQDLKNFFILHEGAIAMADGELNEIDYDDMVDFGFVASEGAKADVTQVAENGWVGFTDHYWMTVLVPEPGSPFKQTAKYDDRRDIYQTEAVLPTVSVAPGEVAQVVTQLYAGAKEWDAIRRYQNQPGFWADLFGIGMDPNIPQIDRFLDAIDWGWFFFLTKPIFAVLHWLNVVIGNMGWAIIGLTLLIKAILFPLAFKSYVSMAKMKELQPEMEKIKERAGDDREKLQKEMMELYKKEKVNPASGCLPILLQIPIFFSLYKVIFVTIELRHAPWFGPFQDLSAPDPTSMMNLFGLLPFDGPDPGSIVALVLIGILPLLLGISMWLQQKLNPAPTDPTQAAIFAWMPWVFMFMLGGFASGLVVYWISNNVITFTQQYLIMRSQGYRPDILGNITSSFKRGDAPATEDKPANKPQKPDKPKK